MKRLITLLLLFLPLCATAQKKRDQAWIDSMLKELPHMKNDTIKVNRMEDIAIAYRNISPEKGIQFARQTLALSRQIGWKKGEARTHITIGNTYVDQGNYPNALASFDTGMHIAEAIGDKHQVNRVFNGRGNAYNMQGDHQKAVELYKKSLKLAEERRDSVIMANSTANIGTIYKYQGDHPKALEYYLSALKIMDKIPVTANKANVLSNIGSIYKAQNDLPKALEYYNKATQIAEDLDFKSGIAKSYLNIGYVYLDGKDFSLALEYTNKSLKVYEMLGDKTGISDTKGVLGAIYRDLRAYDKALKSFYDALKAFKESGAKRSVSQVIGAIGYIYLDQALDTNLAISRSLRLAYADSAILFLSRASASHLQNGSLDFYMGNTESISRAYAFKGAYREALDAYKSYTKYKDSIFNMEKTKDITRKELGYLYSKKEDSLKLEAEKKELSLQKEMQLAALTYEYQRKQAAATTDAERRKLQYEEDLKRQQIADEYKYTAAHLQLRHQRESALAKAEQDKQDALAAAELKRQKNMVAASIAGGLLLLVIAIIAIAAYRQKTAAAETIALEKTRSDDLLLNILPAEIAEELKQSGRAEAKQYTEVSVLFTDFVDFTGTAEQLSPQVLVQELNECFTAFDAIIERNGLEKIKTIGDSYMAVCGLPVSNTLHANNAVQAALEIRNFIDERRKKERVFEIRIGINSGPVVAGIIGVKKFAYDIWGDTVNIAARMQQHGAPGHINISQSTYDLVKDDFRCDYRGKIAAKNKGEIEMYFVSAALAQPA